MQVGDWQRQFMNQVLGRAEYLCRSQIWKIDIDTLYAWMSNFSDREEHRYLASYILSKLIFRSQLMLEVSYKRQLGLFLRNYVNACGQFPYKTLPNWFDFLKRRPKNKSPDLFIAPVRRENDTGESGSSVVRCLTANLINEKRAISLLTKTPSQLKGAIIVLVDDFAGSGDQFTDFANDVKLASWMEHCSIAYSPLMARQDALTRLQGDYPNVTFMPAEVLSNDLNIFSGRDSDLLESDQVNTYADLKNCYEDIRKRHNFSSEYWCGRNDAGLPLAFQWGCPNQSIGILWLNGKKGNWHKLCGRRSV